MYNYFFHPCCTSTTNLWIYFLWAPVSGFLAVGLYTVGIKPHWINSQGWCRNSHTQEHEQKFNMITYRPSASPEIKNHRSMRYLLWCTVVLHGSWSILVNKCWTATGQKGFTLIRNVFCYLNVVFTQQVLPCKKFRLFLINAEDRWCFDLNTWQQNSRRTLVYIVWNFTCQKLLINVKI